MSVRHIFRFYYKSNSKQVTSTFWRHKWRQSVWETFFFKMILNQSLTHSRKSDDVINDVLVSERHFFLNSFTWILDTLKRVWLRHRRLSDIFYEIFLESSQKSFESAISVPNVNSKFQIDPMCVYKKIIFYECLKSYLERSDVEGTIFLYWDVLHSRSWPQTKRHSFLFKEKPFYIIWKVV